MTVRGDHPYTDPGDGRQECETCGKWAWLVIHSCKGVPVTEAAMERMRARMTTDRQPRDVLGAGSTTDDCPGGRMRRER